MGKHSVVSSIQASLQQTALPSYQSWHGMQHTVQIGAVHMPIKAKASWLLQYCRFWMDQLIAVISRDSVTGRAELRKHCSTAFSSESLCLHLCWRASQVYDMTRTLKKRSCLWSRRKRKWYFVSSPCRYSEVQTFTLTSPCFEISL